LFGFVLQIVPSSSRTMAPPPKGTKKYVAYLKHQAARKRKERAEANKEATRASAAKLAAAVRKDEKAKWVRLLAEGEKKTKALIQAARLDERTIMEHQVIAEKQKSNKRMREVNSVATANTALKKHIHLMEVDALADKERRESLEAQLAQKDAEAVEANQELLKWRVWWGRVSERGTPGLLRHLCTLSRAPRPSPGESRL